MTVEPARPTTPAGEIPMAVWRELDWRMLLPTGELGRLLYVGRPSALLVAALNRVARNVRVIEPTAFTQRRGGGDDDQVDTLVLSPAGQSVAGLSRAFFTLRPAGWLVFSAHRWGRRKPLRQLRAHGFTSISAYWHAPNFERCSYLVSLDDPDAVRAVLARHQGVRFGRTKAIAARALLEAGAISFVARDTTFVAERPAP
jgi:hypothetical protein